MVRRAGKYDINKYPGELNMSQSEIIVSADEMERTLERLAYEILEMDGACENVAILGIQRRGVDIAARLRKVLKDRLGRDLPFGELDINFYRDDWTSLQSQPVIGRTHIPFSLDENKVILVDDVLFTGRTIRSALEAVLDHGRPQRVQLLVLIDRGHRELPIQADFVGKTIQTQSQDHVDVLVKSVDGEDGVRLTRN